MSRKRFSWCGIYQAKWLIDKLYNAFCFTDCIERMPLLLMQKYGVERSENVVFENYAKRNGDAATATATTNTQITFLCFEHIPICSTDGIEIDNIRKLNKMA